MNITTDQVREALLFLIALILSISVHEFGHAWIATKLGDPLPRSQGRLSLSPARHIDPIGTLLFPLMAQFTHLPLLGWGRPVQTNPLNYTRRFSPATGQMLVAVSGPLMNLAMALAVSVIIIVGGRAGALSPDNAFLVWRHLVLLNLSLMFFNLLPIPPLDGGAVLAWVLPRSQQHIVDFLARWGFLILLGLSMLGWLGVIMVPVQMLAQPWWNLLVGASGFGVS